MLSLDELKEMIEIVEAMSESISLLTDLVSNQINDADRDFAFIKLGWNIEALEKYKDVLKKRLEAFSTPNEIDFLNFDQTGGNFT